MEQKKEIYAIVGWEKRYLSLLVTIYSNSQFYVLFNERHYYQNDFASNEERELKKRGQILSQLIKRAEKNLNFKIDKVSYNLPVKNLKIIPHNYFYQFKQPTVLTEKKMTLINEKFLEKKSTDNKKYQNFLFKINQYMLLDQREILTKPPLNRTISSLKISGYLYQVHWKEIYNYQQIFKRAKLQPTSPILFPYATHISLLFTEKKANLIIVNWDQEKLQLFYFENKIFIKYSILERSLESLIQKMSEQFNYSKQECNSYLFNLFNFSDDLLINKLDFFVNSDNPKLVKINKGMYQKVKNFLKKVVNEIHFILETKWNLSLTASRIYIVGEITKISGLENFIRITLKKSDWKIVTNNFIGIKDQNDVALIGNAYYHHLQKKIISSENK